MSFDCQLLNPGINPHYFSGKNYLGIEVTIPELAEKCQYGNIDHHGMGCDQNTPSASEQALDYPVYKLPYSTILVTIKPDGDSLTAMAVLRSKMSGRRINERLVKILGQKDRLGPRAPHGDKKTTAMSIVSHDSSMTILERVEWIQNVLEGKINNNELKNLLNWRQKEYEKSTSYENFDIHVSPDKKWAVVHSKYRWGLAIGYEFAPLVIAHNEEFKIPTYDDNDTIRKDSRWETVTKYTIGLKSKHDKLKLISKILKEISNYESGWSGRETIIASPHDKSSELLITDITNIVEGIFNKYTK